VWELRDRIACERNDAVAAPQIEIEAKSDIGPCPRECSGGQATFSLADAICPEWSYGAAKKEIMPGIEHHHHKGLNNGAGNSHQPTYQREQRMEQFKSAGQVQRLLSAHDRINHLFNLRRDHLTAAEHRTATTPTFRVWAEIGSIAATM